MKNRYNKKTKSSYDILLPIIFAVLMWLFLDFFEVYKALHFFNKFVYIEPTFISIVLSHIVIMMNIMMLLILNDKVTKRNKVIKKGKKGKKRKKVIKKESEKNLSKSDKNKIAFCVIATLLISIFCFFSYYYISDDSLNQTKRNLISSEQVFDAEDVNQINIDVTTILHSSRGGGRGYISREYIVQCTIICQENEYILNSGGFKGYDAMYKYITGFKNVKICVNKEDFNQLCTYEKEKIFTTKEKSTNNVMYLEKIFSLGDSK